jgi:RNA polymerase sigma factor (sigma-70 family)
MDADEYIIDGFLAVARKWHQLCGDGHRPVAYAYKVALHAYYKSCRSSPREVPDSDYISLPYVTVDPLDRIIQDQDQVAIRRALDCLPRREKEAVVLRHVNNLSTSECAAIMGISTGAVKRYTSDGLHRLRTVLQQDISEGDGG